MKKSLLPLTLAALLCLVPPAWGQELPEGKGKELVAAQCNSCHPFYARIGGGYNAQGWRTVMRMMLNHGVAMPPEIYAWVGDYVEKNYRPEPKKRQRPKSFEGKEGRLREKGPR